MRIGYEHPQSRHQNAKRHKRNRNRGNPAEEPFDVLTPRQVLQRPINQPAEP